MAKPPAGTAGDIARRRDSLGIDSRYDRRRFHMTLLPLWDSCATSPALFALLDQAVASLSAEPLPIAFDKLSRNALVCSAGTRNVRAFQRQLVRRLIAFGLPIPAYRFNPHLSLAYGAAPEREIATPPIGWLIDELLLIRSIHGEGRHELLHRWPLQSRQGCFRF
jgi:2'-5' RNA ligase